MKVQECISGDDVKESIAALTEEYNMRLTNYVKMYIKEDAKLDEVMEARIWSLCHVESCMLNMEMALAIFGGNPLPKEMLEAALCL